MAGMRLIRQSRAPHVSHAMLAEKKHKQKWSQDPRNCHWSRDKSKYGYRMLQQMGWKEGGGLGTKEDGGTEHIKISRKQDNAGVGSKRGRDDGWIEHQDAFDKILAGLNAAAQPQGSQNSSRQDLEEDDVETISSKTMVQNAMEAKKIVYKRFLRSKDLSAQSSEDLDCVLGRKRRRKVDQGEEKTEIEEGLTTSHGVTTVKNTQSVQDYFSSKMAARTAHGKTVARTTTCSSRKDRLKKKRTSKT